jgi:hypothetical protein
MMGWQWYGRERREQCFAMMVGYGFFGRAGGAGRIQARDLVQSCNAEKVYAMFVYFFSFITKQD